MKQFDKNNNPWKLIAQRMVNNPSTALFNDKEPFIAKQDYDELMSNNLPKDKKDIFNLITSIPPEPWGGNPLKAKLVILTLNPGYIEKQNHILADKIQKIEGINKAIADFKAATLNLTAESFLPEPEFGCVGLTTADYLNIIGDWYWYKKFTPLMEELKMDEVEFFKKVAIIQYLPYTSIAYKDKKYDNIKSIAFTIDLVKHILERENCIVLILRAASKWEKVLNLKDMTVKAKVITNTNRNQSISKGNLHDNFNTIVSIMKGNG
ncbi:MAG: hypothetical protein MJY71_07215 [Bacteroidaceae bacterium]|nr:hypothetical protein [Bacteroidaceae bacterium]